MHLLDYLKIEDKKSYIKVKVVPKSRETSFFSVMDDGTLKIRVKSAPEKGRANKELFEFISRELNIKTGSIKILSWAQDQTKILMLDF